MPSQLCRLCEGQHNIKCQVLHQQTKNGNEQLNKEKQNYFIEPYAKDLSIVHDTQ